mgnify:CR=1 FL=1
MSFHDFAWRAKELRRGRTASKATGRPLLPNTRSRQMTQAITCAFPRLRVSRGKVSDAANAAHSGHGRNPDRQVQTARGERAIGKRASCKRQRYEIRNPAALHTQTQVGPIQMDGTHLHISREPIPRAFLFLGASVTLGLCYLTRSNLSSRSRQTEHSRLLTSTHQGHAQGNAESTQTNGRNSVHTCVRKTLLRRKRRAHARQGNSR